MERIIPANKKSLSLVADNQYGYFTADQAIKNGYRVTNHSYHIRVGNWLRVDTGLFRLPGYTDTLESDFTRWYLWSRNKDGQPQGVITHQSALKLRNLGDYEPGRIHLTVPMSFRKHNPSEVAIHKASLNLSAIETRRGFLVTRMSRTLEDLRPFLEAQGVWRETVEKSVAMEVLSREEAAALGFTQKACVLAKGMATVLPASSAERGSRPIDASAGVGNETVAAARADSEAMPLTSTLLTASMPAEGTSSPPTVTPGISNEMSERIYHMIFQRTQATPTLRRRAQAGFTLVELLVVVAIISVLAGMLLPALGRSLELARSISCSNNLKTVFMGTRTYADDYRDRIIASWAYTPSVPYGYSGYTDWIHQLVYWGYIPGGFNTSITTWGSHYRNEACVCPSRNRPGLTVSCGGIGINNRNASSDRYTFDGFKRPSQKILVMDCGCLTAGSFTPMSTNGGYSVDYRHLGMLNAAHVDGHIGSYAYSQYGVTYDYETSKKHFDIDG